MKRSAQLVCSDAAGFIWGVLQNVFGDIMLDELSAIYSIFNPNMRQL